MKHWSMCVVGALVVLGVSCGPSRSGVDAGRTGGGTGFTGGGTGGSGGGFGTGGGTGGGAAGGRAGGAGGGSATGGGMAGGDAGGAAGGMGMPFDGGGLVGGETCTNAVVLPGSSGVITSTTMGLGHDYLFTSANGCAASSSASTAPDVAYAVEVPAGQRLIASVTTTWDATINLIAAPPATCGDDGDGGVIGMATCLAGTDIATAGTDTATWFNTGAMPVTVYVVIDGYSMGEGDFTLNVSVAPPPMGDECATAQPLAVGDAGVLLATESFAGFGADYSNTTAQGCDFLSGTDRVYSLSIPAGLRLSVRAESAFDLSLSVIDDLAQCTSNPVVCSTGANNTSFGMMQTEALIVDNTTATPRPVLLVVDSSSSAPVGATFSLEFSLGVPPAGDTCQSAVAVAIPDAGVVLPTEMLTAFANDFDRGTGCDFGGGPDRVYALTVPPNLRLTARVVSNDNLALSAIDDVAQCTAATVTCVASADDSFIGMAQTEVLTVENSTSMPRPVLLVVDAISSAPASTFSLELSAGPIPPGETCALPASLPLVSDGGVTDAGVSGSIAVLTNEPLMGFTSDFGFSTNSMGCTFAAGPDRVYQVPVGAGQRVEVTASSTADLALNLVQDAMTCSMSPLVCLADSDMAGSGSMMMPAVESLRYDNTTTTPRTMVVVVDAFGASASAAFDLDVRVRPIPPPPYLSATMSGMCDSFAAVTPIPLLTDSTMPALADDETSDTLALPFAFSYFGAPVTHYSVSSNGFLQLYPSAMGAGSASASNDPIPTASTPNGVVAPFWDDLDVISPTGSRVIGGVFGTGSARHFTVQWEQLSVFGVAGSSLTFQARLYETTNVVELHACSLTAGSDPADMDRERGLEATIGIESTDGLDGNQAAYNTAYWMAGQLLRYTPR